MEELEKSEKDFEKWLQKTCIKFNELSELQKNSTIDQLIRLCGPEQLHLLSTKLEILVKRDFLKNLPLELCYHILKWLDTKSLFNCCKVSKIWNKVVSTCNLIWQRACKRLGMKIDENELDNKKWKELYLKAERRMHSLKKETSYETVALRGHTARVFALCYRSNMLATGSDDRSVRLWDLNTGHCQHVLLTHTCADISFDIHKVVTASFDNTIGMWEWSTGQRRQCYQGHTGAVFCVDYSDELDVIVSGSADTTVKIWSMSKGMCTTTKYGHTDWVTKIILCKSKVNSDTHKIGDYVLLSMDKKTIKVWSLDKEAKVAMATLPLQDDNVHLQPRLQFDGYTIACASDNGVYIWDFKTLHQKRCFTSPPCKWLVAYGRVFSLLVDSSTLYIVNTPSEQCIASRDLPPFRRSARGSNFTPCDTIWLDDFSADVTNTVFFATSMPDYTILISRLKDVT